MTTGSGIFNLLNKGKGSAADSISEYSYSKQSMSIATKSQIGGGAL